MANTAVDILKSYCDETCFPEGIFDHGWGDDEKRYMKVVRLEDKENGWVLASLPCHAMYTATLYDT